MAGVLTDDSLTLSVHECSIKGGERLTVNSSSPLPHGELYLLLSGIETHRVATERVSPTCLYATLPAHKRPETVELSLHLSSDDMLLFKTQFAYVVDQRAFMAELLQSVTECSDPSLLPPLPTPEALREFDQALAASMSTIDLPPKWSLVQQNCSQKETLLHFAVRHGLNSLSQHLLSLPGSAEAVFLPDQHGQLPIDIARGQGNEGLSQLLTLYMSQLHSNGVVGDSPLISPISMERSSDVSQPSQDLEKFKEINQEWTSQVKRYRHLTHSSSLTNLTNLDQPNEQTNTTLVQNGSAPPIRHLPVRRRRSSVAVLRRSGEFLPATPLEAVVINTRDPGLAAMERSRKSSWSRVVGSSYCRSVGTGLNELDRISAEDTIHKKLVEVKTELAQLDNKRQDSPHSKQYLGLSETQLRVMYRLSSSCPSLGNDDDDADVSAVPSAVTSPGRTNSPFSDEDAHTSPQSSLTTLEGSGSNYQRLTVTVGSIPHVVTTEYPDQTQLDPPSDVTRQTYSESELMMFANLSASNEGPRASSMSILSESSLHGEDVNVEESIAEHRQLTQTVSSSPASSEPAVRSDDDYVLVNNTPERGSSPSVTLTNSDSMTPVGTPNDAKETRIPTPLRSGVRYKNHRRSLSSSEVEMMRSGVTFAADPPNEKDSSTPGWNSPQITSIEESDNLLAASESSRVSVEFDERSRASSLQTNDTCSMHESDTSGDDGEYLSAKESISVTSLTQPDHLSPNEEEHEATDAVCDNTVVIRDTQMRQRIRASKPNRYSTGLVNSLDDYHNEESEPSPELEPKLRANSSNIIDSSTATEDTAELTTPKCISGQQFLLQPKPDDNVFAHTSDLSPSEIDLSFKSGDNSLDNSQSSLFFKPTGSPKTIKSRKNKSPLVSRRQTIANTRRDNSPSRKGLTKQEVGPTISALKDLIKPLSDNEEMEHHFELSGHSNTSDQIEDSRPRSTSSPRTQLETPPPEAGDDECTSLDFAPSSPLVRDKQKLSVLSPLTIDHTKSPPLDRERYSSSPSPAPHPEDNDDRTKQSPNSSDLTPSLSKESLLRNDSSTREVRFSSPTTDLCPIPSQQDECSAPKEKEKARWREKIFRSKRPGSKEHAKSQEMSKSQDTEAMSTEISKQSRARSRKHKYEEVVLKYVSAKDYDQQSSQPQPSLVSPINRSASMQVGMDHIGSEQPAGHRVQHSRSTSVQEGEHPRIHLMKRQSEYTLGPLEEVPSDSSPSPHLLPTSTQVGPPSGESENEEQNQEEYQLVKSLSVSHPVLEIHEEPSWDKTVDRRLYKKMNKAERERQAILYELLQTEKNHFRNLHVLKLIFRQQMTKVTSEENMTQLFPELDNLIEISDGFLKRLESKTGRADDIIIDDLSDVLLEQFSGKSRDRMLHSFGRFCSGHLNATEIYKEHMKKKSFSRLMKQLHSLKECQRLTLPDYYLAVSQRLAKLLTLLKRLAKKSESLKLDHAPQVRQSLENLEELITAVDKTVLDNKVRMEVEAIQSRLEVNVPRFAKMKEWQEVKNLNLTAQDRRLRKRGMAQWIGHGREVSVHLVLLTDMVVLLTERDQKYHLASLQDLKPPVIRLYDLHVRLNVSVKSGVQLLLLEKGNFPEMFRLEFVSKKLAREWETALNSAIDECKEKGLKCEHFGVERVVSGDEEKKSEQKEESDIEEPDVSSPALKSMQRAREALAFATKLLTVGGSSTTSDSSRHHGVAIVTTGGGLVSRPFMQDIPKNRNRSHTVQRPKTAFFAEDETNSAGSSSTIDHVISAPIPTSGKAAKSFKAEKKRGSKLDRSSTFRSKDKERDKNVGFNETDSFRVPEQQYIQCITNLKDCLQEMMNQNEEKDSEIDKLRNEIESLRDALQSPAPSPPLPSRLSPRSSPQARPHSIHIDHTHMDEDASPPQSDREEGNQLQSQSELLVNPSEGTKLMSKDSTPNGSMVQLAVTSNEH